MHKILILFSLLVIGESCSSLKEDKVNVAVAANMLPAILEIAARFETKYGVKVELSSASSGTLTTQITQGAPFDIFLSANAKYPKWLFEQKKAKQQPVTFAYGSLIWYTAREDIILDDDLQFLKDNHKLSCAIANPKTAPYGEAALEFLENSERIKTGSLKIVFGENVSQVNQYITSRAVDVGVTSLSAVFPEKLQNDIYYLKIDPSTHSPIRQTIVMIDHGLNHDYSRANQFYEFIHSTEAKSVLSSFGYTFGE